MYRSLLFAFAGFATAASSVKRQTTDAFGLYAYGQDIGGWTVKYSDGSAYITVANEDISGYSGVNFTTTSDGLMTQGTVTISSTSSSNDTSAVNKLLAITTDANVAVAFVDAASDTEVTDQWTFFGQMLTYQSTQATFQAVPLADNGKVYQIYWVSDSANAPTGGVPVVIKKSAPSGPAQPGGPAADAATELKKKRSGIARH